MIEPSNAELQLQLSKARREADEAEKQRLLKKAVTKVGRVMLTQCRIDVVPSIL